MVDMQVQDVPWWRWRGNVRSALHMLSDVRFQHECWLGGVPGYGDVTDAVYRLVEDTWLDSWSADKYVGTIFRDDQEAVVVDAAVLKVLRIMHQVGADAPTVSYLEHPDWPEAVQACREAHLTLSTNDGEDPNEVPRSLEALALMMRAV